MSLLQLPSPFQIHDIVDVILNGVGVLKGLSVFGVGFKDGKICFTLEDKINNVKLYHVDGKAITLSNNSNIDTIKNGDINDLESDERLRIINVINAFFDVWVDSCYNPYSNKCLMSCDNKCECIVKNAEFNVNTPLEKLEYFILKNRRVEGEDAERLKSDIHQIYYS